MEVEQNKKGFINLGGVMVPLSGDINLHQQEEDEIEDNVNLMEREEIALDSTASSEFQDDLSNQSKMYLINKLF